MPHKNRTLSHNEVQTLEVITKYPGLTPYDLSQKLPDITASSLSAICSRLTWLKRINRRKVAHSSTFTYYPKDAVLPPGASEWHNELVRIQKRTRKSNGESPKEAIDTLTRDLFEPKRTDNIVGSGLPNVLIVLPLAEKETITVTIEQARTIWAQLNSIFAK